MSSQLTKIRKVKLTEIFYEVAQREFGMMISSYWLKLGSKRRLEEEHVEEALRILYRNADNLSLCLLEEGEDTWFCRMEKEVIDLEVLRNRSPDDVFQEEMHKSFNSKVGPLWRVKYIINKDDTPSEHKFISKHDESSSKHDELQEPDGIKTLHEEFQSDIIFSFNHVITDGFTIFNICKCFLKALNDVVGGTVQSTYNFGKLNDGSESEELAEKRSEFFKNNPDLFAKIKDEMAEMEKDEVILGDTFPVPKDVINKTKYIYRDLDKETTSKLLKKFKENGVSFNSGFAALTNWALMDILSENDLSLQSLDIAAFHMMNKRRYWKKSSEIQQGSHVGIISVKTTTDRNVGDNFWQYAQDLHDLLKKYILENRCTDQMIAQGYFSHSEEKLDFEAIMRSSATPKIYYSITNMGDVTSLLQGSGKYVGVNWFTRCTSAHTGHNCWTHIIQTYEGRFLYGLGYYTNFTRDDFANMYVDKIFENICLLTN